MMSNSAKAESRVGQLFARIRSRSGKLFRITNYSMGLLHLRTDDVWLASYPKAGNTWVRFILCNILSLTEMGGAAVDFHRLDETMPALGYSSLDQPWPFVALPRFVKTHLPYNRWLLGKPRRAIYVLRDPRDVMVSYFHFQRAHTQRPYRGSFQEFIREPLYGLERAIRHSLTWLPQATYVVSYEALKQDAVAVMADMLSGLSLSVPESVVKEAVERSTFKKVRSHQDRSGLSGEERFSAQFRFARSGRSGEWATIFNDDDLDFYRELCERNDFWHYGMGS